MPRSRRDHQLRLRPSLVQVPGVLRGADDVVAAVHDDAGNAVQAVRVAQQLVVDVEEAAVDEIVVLDAREAQREMRVVVALDEVGVQQELVEPSQRPRARGGEARRLVGRGQAAVVGADQVAALDLGDRRDVVLPGFREQARRRPAGRTTSAPSAAA